MADDADRPEQQDEAKAPPCPWLDFDAEWYAARHLRRHVAGEPTDPQEHYARVGLARGYGPNPFFDEAWYRATYADARAAIRRGHFASGFAHYCAVGFATHNPHWLFDERLYLAKRPDVTSKGLQASGLRNGYHHYLIAGQNEGASGSPFFDPVLFAEATGIADQPFTALVTAPALTTLRLSPYFDPAWYQAMHPEVGHLVAEGRYQGALHHYLTNPTPAAFAGSADFDEAYYRARNKDVAADLDAGRLRTGYQHFLLAGRLEGRRPSPWFDPVFYRGLADVASALTEDPLLTPFDHYLRTGKALGLPTLPPPHLVPPAQRAGTEAAGRDIFARMAHLRADLAWRGGLRFDRPDAPDVSVVIVGFNQFDLTMQTLDSLAASRGVSFEVVFVDNASTDETRRIEGHAPGMTVLRNELNEGFVYGANQGIEAARGRHVLLLNNDVLIDPHALRHARDRLDHDPGIGAVGGRIVRTHGALQEAGCIVFRDGGTMGYGRDADPFDPQYDFVREVDFCSGVFLMIPRAALDRVGLLDEEYAPAYYEEVDLCARLWQAGLRVVYDPAILVQHLEYGSSRNPDAPRALMRHNRNVFLARHGDWVAGKCVPDPAMALEGRAARRRRRVLFIEDVVPYRHLGSGFGRAADIVASLAALDCDVTVLPVNPSDLPPGRKRAGFPETVEILHDHELSRVPAFFAAREGYYDTVWLCRAHNLARLASVVGGAWGPLRHARVVLDTEALASNRLAALAELEGRAFDLGAALARELTLARIPDALVCVTAQERRQAEALGFPVVTELGHAMTARPGATPFAQRRDILALGSLHAADTPNADGLLWFITQVWPRVRAAIAGVRLLIGGYAGPGIDAAALFAAEGVEHLGFVEDPAPFYDQARVFLAPTRFSAGAPFKVLEAAAAGLPVMATAPLARQLGWEADAIASADAADPAAFAAALMALYTKQAQWKRVRAGALARIEAECDPAQFRARVGEIIGPFTP